MFIELPDEFPAPKRNLLHHNGRIHLDDKRRIIESGDAGILP
jgi:hypothetical protein